MLPDFGDLAIERDADLVQGLCRTALNNRRDLEGWIEAELRAVLYAAEIQEQSLPDGVIRNQITAVVERLRRTATTVLPEAIEVHDQLRRDVLNGDYANVHDAYRRLERETAHLVEILEDLLSIREFIGEMGDG